MEFLPSEIVSYLFTFLRVKDAKSLALTSKACYRNSLKRLWEKPKYTVCTSSYEQFILLRRDFALSLPSHNDLVSGRLLHLLDTKSLYFGRSKLFLMCPVLDIAIILFSNRHYETEKRFSCPMIPYTYSLQQPLKNAFAV